MAASVGTVQVVGAAILDGGRLLAAQRSGPPHLAGGWELPGGKVEPGESPQDALVRECREELGVDVEVCTEVAGHYPISAGVTLRVWIARVVTGEPLPGPSHQALRWLEPHAWHAVDWLDADRPVIDALERQIRTVPQ